MKLAGISAAVFDLLIAGTLTSGISGAVLAEYREVLYRPVLQPHAGHVQTPDEPMGTWALQRQFAEKRPSH